MASTFQEMIAQFKPENAEETYGALYQFCASDELNKHDAHDAFEHVLGWIDENGDHIARSYGLLILGGLIDSGKLEQKHVMPKLKAFILACATKVADYRVLDEQNRFVHFVSHFAYLAGSCCEQFNGEVDGLQDIVQALIDLFLAAPDAYWCGEEMLVARTMLEANLSDETFALMMDGLKPELVMQDADKWDSSAVLAWKSGVVRENHKRQLVMVLQGMNVLLKEKPANVFDGILAQNVEARFG